jgi:hypothetical protein
MLKYCQIYRRVEAEAKHEKEFDGSANNRGVIANRPYMDTWLTRHPYIGSVTETICASRSGHTIFIWADISLQTGNQVILDG